MVKFSDVSNQEKVKIRKSQDLDQAKGKILFRHALKFALRTIELNLKKVRATMETRTFPHFSSIKEVLHFTPNHGNPATTRK